MATGDERPDEETGSGGPTGQAVCIVDGAFKGLPGTLAGFDGDEILVDLDIFGRTTRVRMYQHQVSLSTTTRQRTIDPADYLPPARVQVFGMRATRPLPVDPVRFLPELASMARTTIRLHPHRGEPEAGDSSVGGPLLWPVTEEWPTCSVPYVDPGDFEVDLEHRRPVPLVPVLQLYQRDVAALPFPDGKDVLQVLWCPFDHRDDRGGTWPRPELYWRNEAATRAEGIGLTPNPPQDIPSGKVPQPCFVDPEQVTEYPYEDEDELRCLGDDRRLRLEDIKEQTGWSYQSHLSVAPGVKVGGWPGWTQWPDWPTCRCGRRMDHLLTVSSDEYDVESGLRWAPVVMVRADIDPRTDSISRGFSPTDLRIGDMGGMYLFICPKCPDAPWASRFDCC
ncbi:hypothetical protein O7626_13370 [Micromonospora sp. WMMD1102]|uniref:hypothetical protein n=1 Tax=Micromonospora sp. WMMD1102 TaxID=3016105 RepID=UPI0024155897|nr:hypothetical protein [Micromonospora sp. WMMD1102]MDG4786909.1 hypothetical protein [Micromonospora sp. WMMD1102]